MSVYRRAPDMKDDWQAFLDHSYHHLCRSVRVEDFLSWLRSKKVLTADDQEEVLNTFVTSVMKTGNLIDKIKMKGRHGFDAFMEVVEYVYPETFNILTGKEPRSPPKDFDPSLSMQSSTVREKRGPALSAAILGQMGDLVNILSQANACKKEELAKLQTYVKQLQEENKMMCDEKHSVLLKFKDAQEQLDKLQQKIDELSQKQEQDSEEKQKILTECEKLRELKDKYMKESQKLREDRDSKLFPLNERGFHVHRSTTVHATTGNQSHVNQLPINQSVKTPLQLIKEDYLQLKEKQRMLTKSSSNEETEQRFNSSNQNQKDFNQMQHPLKENENQTNQKFTASAELLIKLEEWQNRCDLLQERYDKVLINLDEVQSERDQMRYRCNDLQEICKKQNEQNERLTVDCEKYKIQFCDMANKMSSLFQEIDELHVQSPTSCVNGCSASVNGQYSPSYERAQSLEPELTDRKCPSLINQSDETKAKSLPKKQIQYIEQSPGECPRLKRQVVKVEGRKPNSS